MTLTLIATAVLNSTTQPASANHDFYATVGRIGKAMDALQSEFPTSKVGCGRGDNGFYLQNNEGCGLYPEISDKNWSELGYSAFAVFGRAPGEHQSEFAFMASIYSDSSQRYSKQLPIGSHSGLATSVIDGNTLLTYLWWGDGRTVFAIFHGERSIWSDFNSLDNDDKQARIDTVQNLAKDYAQRLESKLIQFEAYDATAPIEEEKKHLPIIFLPGVGGSELLEISTNSGVWPVVGSDSRMLVLREDGKNPLDISVQINATDILRSFPANYYGGMIEFLGTKNYTLGTDLFLFPYDWRKDNTEHLRKLDNLVNQVLKSTDSKKVMLIAHSMGGLISKAYISTTGETKVDTLITIGTPFFGAVKPYYALVHGYNFDNPAVTTAAMKMIAQNAPAVYQLLPRVPFVVDNATHQAVPLEELYPRIAYKAVAEGATSYYEMKSNIQLMNKELIKTANSFHTMIGTKESPKPLPPGVNHYAIIGQGISTLSGYTLRDANPDKEEYSQLGQRNIVQVPVFQNGDGTVPLWSAEISGVTSTYYASNKPDSSAGHGALTDNQEVQIIVSSILAGKPELSSSYRRSESPPLKEKTDFTLHSDAHLSIVDSGSGRVLGVRIGQNGEQFVDETISSGTIIVMGDKEYASVADGAKTYTVYVNGTQEGEFTLDIDVSRNSGTEHAKFSYQDVSVKEGTITRLQISPDRITNESDLPILDVYYDGAASNTGSASKSSVNAEVTEMSLTAYSGSGNNAGDGTETPPTSGGGCLIATAAFGSELSPQVQFLRDFRDNRILLTSSGSAFMNAFNAWYYSFSPHVADYERQQPWLQQTVKISIYPLLGILYVAEGAYSAIPGEYGALSAGLIASALIGAVYISPLAMLSVKQVRKTRVDYRLLALVVVGSSLAVVASIIIVNPLILTVTTTILVLVTAGVSSMITANAIARLLGRLRKGDYTKRP